ncbi:MAG TPA: DUF4383 domain-containing protein [Candidatus Kapabacteria bacterium]|nr:DUF4383 domain-containing protein [Candidatus Kapabacteria bacterium]
MFIRYGVGIVATTYTLLGVIGFLPVEGINSMHHEGIGVHYLFNIIAINVVHNLIHLGIGISGLFAMRTLRGAQMWGKIVGVVLLLVFAAGMVQAVMEGFPRDQWLLGIVPLNSPGHTLHLATGVVALYLGLAKASAQTGVQK